MSSDPRLILTLSCDDKPGIVAGVASTLANVGGNIVESHQYGDAETGRFFMRVLFQAPAGLTVGDVKGALGAVAKRFGMTWDVVDSAAKARLIVMVSKFDHCLQDLLYRARLGALPVEIVAIVSNHETSRGTADANGIAFHHWPVTPETKRAQEERLFALVDEVQADLVVLARYMQVLSDEASQRISGRAINIHHSFLPAFVGGRPYHQAHARGVKVIGATAHYATAELDEGPIIEQDVVRVTHRDDVDALVHAGRDLETVVLARAVRWHLTDRVIVHGNKTVVFS